MPSSVTKYMIDTSKARFSRVAQMVSKVRPVVVCFLSNTAWVTELGKPHIVFLELEVNPLETSPQGTWCILSKHWILSTGKAKTDPWLYFHISVSNYHIIQTSTSVLRDNWTIIHDFSPKHFGHIVWLTPALISVWHCYISAL